MKIGSLYKIKNPSRGRKFRFGENNVGLYVGIKEIYNVSGLMGRTINHVFLINGETREFSHRILDYVKELKTVEDI